MKIQTNVMSLNAHRNKKNTGLAKRISTHRLATGFRINTAADDAAGLAISENMRAQIRGLDKASRNTQDAVALVQTMEGGLHEISSMIIRQRELVIQALNDTNSQANRQMIQAELDQLSEEITSLAYRTEYNTIPLLIIPAEGLFVGGTVSVTMAAGEPGNVTTDPWGWIYVPANASFTVWVQTTGVTGNWPDLVIRCPQGQNFGWNQGGFWTSSTASNLVTYAAISAERVFYSGINSIVPYPHRERFEIRNTTVSGRWHVAMSNRGGTAPITFHLSVGDTPGQDPNVPPLVLVPFVQDVFQENPLHMQVGPNSRQAIWVSRFDARAESLGIGMVNAFPPSMANASLVRLDAALDRVNRFRATAGAYQNRLEHTTRHADIASENMQDAESRIRNTDMAREMMRVTKSGVLQQVAVLMLAQANRTPEAVLQLLR